MQDHSDADEQFYLTANITLNIAKRAKEIFESSEVEEKNQFLRYLLQNSTLNGKNLEFTMVSPFNLIAQYRDGTTMRRTVEAVRTWYEGQDALFYIPSIIEKTA